MLLRKTAHSTSKAGGAQRAPLFARVLTWLFSTIQLALIPGFFYLDKLSRSRGGVHRHVYYMKGVYTAEHGLASLAYVLMATQVISVITVIFFIILFATKKRRSRVLAPLSVINYSVLLCSALAFAYLGLSEAGQAHLLYPYLLAGVLTIWVLALLNSALALTTARS